MSLVDKKGRKFLLVLGTSGIIVSLVSVGVMFLRTEKQSVDCRGGYSSDGGREAGTELALRWEFGWEVTKCERIFRGGEFGGRSGVFFSDLLFMEISRGRRVSVWQTKTRERAYPKSTGLAWFQATE